ncbi:hypothetical protein ILYODFUR_020240, partial [Ilyodon furcidens]
EITAHWCSTRDWAVKLECQAGINLAAYVHINTFIIWCTEEGHMVGGTPTDIQKGHKTTVTWERGNSLQHGLPRSHCPWLKIKAVWFAQNTSTVRLGQKYRASEQGRKT